MVSEAADIRVDDTPEEAPRQARGAASATQDVADRARRGDRPERAPPSRCTRSTGRRASSSRSLAADGPLVALIDDIHWAEPAFLDLLEHVLDTSEDAPILLLCTARHELLEKRPSGASGRASLRLVLQPLSDAAAAQVAANLLGATGLPADVVGAHRRRPPKATRSTSSRCCRCSSTAARCAQERRALGARRRATARSTIPPTIKALLEARLGQLGARSARRSSRRR